MTYSRWTFAWCLVGLTTTCAFGQVSPADLASTREDINGLSQRLADLALRVEQLEYAQKSAAEPKPRAETVTREQFDAAVGQLSAQIDELRAALAAASAAKASAEAVSDAPAPKAPVSKPPAFSSNFPKEGITYTVQKGDTVASIAKKTTAKFSDIVNANHLADPSLIRIGQPLFIPGGK